MFKHSIETSARNLWFTGSMLIAFGLVLAAAARVGTYRRDVVSLTVKDGTPGGLTQACALIPGASRSGATIAMA